MEWMCIHRQVFMMFIQKLWIGSMFRLLFISIWNLLKWINDNPIIENKSNEFHRTCVNRVNLSKTSAWLHTQRLIFFCIRWTAFAHVPILYYSITHLNKVQAYIVYHFGIDALSHICATQTQTRTHSLFLYCLNIVYMQRTTS